MYALVLDCGESLRFRATDTRRGFRMCEWGSGLCGLLCNR